MSKDQARYDDEIDLFEVFETLWARKWFIVGLTVCFMAMGAVYSMFSEDRFEVNVPYKINLYSIESQQICENNIQSGRDWSNIECLNSGTASLMLAQLSDWSNDAKTSTLSLSTQTPKSATAYIDELNQVNQVMGQSLLQQAQQELSVITTEISTELLGTERVATNLLNAKRLIYSIEKNQIEPVVFGQPSVTKSGPKPSLIIVASMFLGGMLSLVIVLVLSAIKNRQDKLA